MPVNARPGIPPAAGLAGVVDFHGQHVFPVERKVRRQVVIKRDVPVRAPPEINPVDPYFTVLINAVKSDDDFAAVGGNQSLVHIDFMIGSHEMNVDGLKEDGTAEPIMRDGEWAFEV